MAHHEKENQATTFMTPDCLISVESAESTINQHEFLAGQCWSSWWTSRVMLFSGKPELVKLVLWG